MHLLVISTDGLWFNSDKRHDPMWVNRLLRNEEPDGLKLGSIEQMVYEIIASGRAEPANVPLIAEFCSLSELQVKVAIQLLQYKDLI